jgi:hypothetical protein
MRRRAQGTDTTLWGVRLLGTLRDSCKEALETGHLSLWELCLGEPGGWGSSARDPEGYERKALRMGISHHVGSVGQPGVGSSTEDFEIWLKGALEGECVSRSLALSVKGTWREGSLAGDPERYVEKDLEMGISFHRGPVWGTWRRAHLLGTLRAG